eukprot:442867_1
MPSLYPTNTQTLAPSITPIEPDGEIFCNQAVNITFNDSIGITKYYQFILDVATDVVTFGNCKTKYDTRLQVYNDLGQEISDSYCDGDDCGNCVSDDNNEIFDILSMMTGIYFIKVSPYNSDTTRIGPYVLEVLCSTYIPTTAKPSNSPTTAYPTRATVNPTTRQPTGATQNPSTTMPTNQPTAVPSDDS